MNQSREAFNQFYRHHVRLVFAMALAHGSDNASAEDAVQETMLRAWRHFDRLQQMAPLAQRAWLVTVVRNVVCTARRRRTPLTIDTVGEGEPCPESSAPVTLRLDIAAALAALPVDDREIVVLRYFGDQNSREIGEMLQLPEGTVRRRLAACRQHLATHLAAWKPEQRYETNTVTPL